MTGIADLYLYIKYGQRKPLLTMISHMMFGDESDDISSKWSSSKERNKKKDKITKFVVLAWKRTGSNLLCGILYHHPEIIMHNELFNTIDIFTYYPELIINPLKWSVLTRDLYPDAFLKDVWASVSLLESKSNVSSSSGTVSNTTLNTNSTITTKKKKAVGFKSFPEHWTAVRNDSAWTRHILENHHIKKVILKREDELRVYISTIRADETGMYLGMHYPTNFTVHIDPASFQRFINNYRDTYQNKYKSPWRVRDTFYITYEQLTNNTELFETNILPKLWNFLNVDPTVPMKQLKETFQQSNPNEDLSTIISNYKELEFCFRYTDVSYFVQQRQKQQEQQGTDESFPVIQSPNLVTYNDDSNNEQNNIKPSSWSILLPICSRGKRSQYKRNTILDNSTSDIPNVLINRFLQLTKESQHDPNHHIDDMICWTMLQDVCTTLHNTTTTIEQLQLTEIIVGIDIDDPVYYTKDAKQRIIKMLLPCTVKFVDIQKTMYGKVCSIWSHLAKHSTNDYVVLLGDDIRLLSVGWQQQVVRAFYAIAQETKLPLGAACVCFNDISFPGYPTFPVVHRWHINLFKSLLPKQFVNQGGDPYLFELYSRHNAACFVTDCCLENTIGGDGDARYKKHEISWQGQILTMNLKKLQKELGPATQCGFVMDIVVPSYRINNLEILSRIAKLRASVKAYVKFWFIVDNTDPNNLKEIKDLASRLNQEQPDGNYFVNVIHYSANRGASFARNAGYNHSTADWILFLDDDVIPKQNIIDAYIGAVIRYPNSRVFVGYTELPDACNLWTEILKTCNVGYFYSIAKWMVHPSWGVTANLMVYGSRFNRTIQFKNIYPKTGGGEDIDFVYQYKEFYGNQPGLVAAVPEAIVHHPWWKNGGMCYSQITGWAKGDSLCITEWPKKTFLTFPNWIEHVVFIVLPLTIYLQSPFAGIIAALLICLFEHLGKGWRLYSNAVEVTGSNSLRTGFIAISAGTILSSQEVQRVICLIQRCSFYSICRRVDWFDGQRMAVKLDIQLSSIMTFVWNMMITWMSFYVTSSIDSKVCSINKW